MENRIDIADRLNAMAEELVGLSQILSIMREHEEQQGDNSEKYYLLQTTTERLGEELKEIAEDL